MEEDSKNGRPSTAFFDGTKTSPSNWCRQCNGNGVVFETVDYYFPKRIRCPQCGGHGVFPIEFDFRPSPFLVWVNPPAMVGHTPRGIIRSKTNVLEGDFLSGEIQSGTQESNLPDILHPKQAALLEPGPRKL